MIVEETTQPRRDQPQPQPQPHCQQQSQVRQKHPSHPVQPQPQQHGQSSLSARALSAETGGKRTVADSSDPHGGDAKRSRRSGEPVGGGSLHLQQPVRTSEEQGGPGGHVSQNTVVPAPPAVD